MKPAVVIQTDFSLTWSAVAQMKGVMKQVDPTLELVDLCHEIKSFDPWEASLSLQETVPYWPAGTIFVSVVDPGVGTSRRACAAKLNSGTIVVTPDNGTLTHLVHSVGINEVREIDETVNRFHGSENVSVFHGRDLFGYCAAKLAAGVITFEEVGPAYAPQEILECEEYSLKPVLETGHACGFIVTGVKHYGGIRLNIPNSWMRDSGIALNDLVTVEICHNGTPVYHADMPYVPSFGYVKTGEPLLYEGSSGTLCIDLNQANFMETCQIATGKDWTVTIQKVGL